MAKPKASPPPQVRAAMERHDTVQLQLYQARSVKSRKRNKERAQALAAKEEAKRLKAAADKAARQDAEIEVFLADYDRLVRLEGARAHAMRNLAGSKQD